MPRADIALIQCKLSLFSMYLLTDLIPLNDVQVGITRYGADTAADMLSPYR